MTDHSDIAIIGGGVAGLTAAAALAPHADVTVIEAEDHLAYHASGRSAAMFLESYGNATVRALNEASADHHRTADGGVLTPRPFLLIGRADEARAFATEARSFGMTDLSVAEAQRYFPLIDPAVIAHAALRDDTADLDTDLLIQNARRRARAHGARIITGARATAITRDTAWRVTTAAGELTATTLLNAAGAWADDIARMAGVAPLGITPYRRSMARIPLPPGTDPAAWAFVDAVGESWYAKPDAGGLIVSPSEEDPSAPMDAWADDMVIAEGLARFEAAVTIEVTRVIATWAGLRSFAPDRTLVIGRDPGMPDFFWLAGQGGYGFQTAPAAAALTADLLTGRTPGLPSAIVTALSPERFHQ
ncbi:NAD(P)/FAD-dependent oxidoreductase [Pseudooceanicola onchidii]|uniref:NAD(P)/FAD-dependent oxidoreductase n=1 Tax=Pseudooceanicola onchidii TaxID=2562279 RepID=UPI0010AAF20D|nr:FAD-binding oxidoreductase [Pseudooceanicola onchidii]